jgi:hypothetical protein
VKNSEILNRQADNHRTPPPQGVQLSLHIVPRGHDGSNTTNDEPD